MPNEPHPLRLTAVKVLEDWALMLVEESPEAHAMFDKSKPFHMAYVNLHGVLTGSLSILAQDGFVNTLAANLLGGSDAEQPSAEECMDAFKEMGNVLAGNFLTEAYGDDTVFDLLHPSVKEVSTNEAETFFRRKVVFYFVADESPVAVTFSIDESL